MPRLVQASLVVVVASALVNDRSILTTSLGPEEQSLIEENTNSADNETDGDDHRMGLLLWSDGRSATKSLFDTLQASLDMKFCNGRKEPFICIPGDGRHPNSQDCPTTQRLKKCIKRDGYIYGAHIKPIHLNRGTGPKDLTNPWMLMGSAARKVGIELVVSVLRENFLARMVSDFDLQFTEVGRHKGMQKGSQEWLDIADKFFLRRKLKQAFAEEFKRYKQGVKAARLKNISILEFTFADLTTDMCNVVQQIATAMRKLGWAAYLNRPEMLENPACQVLVGHTEVSDHKQDLAGRIGEPAAQKVIKQLTGSKFEWMLDIEAIAPPPGTPLLRGLLRWNESANRKGNRSATRSATRSANKSF